MSGALDTPVAARGGSGGAGTVSVGDELDPLVIDVTATLIVAGAIATRDFMPAHHDRDFANAQGAPMRRVAPS